MVLTCPRCGRIAGDEDAAYCAFCGSILRDKRAGRTAFLIAGSILAIITACMCAAWGIAGMMKFLDYMGYYDYFYYHFELPIGLFLTDGVLGLLAFAIGLSGGIMWLRRRNIALGMLGACCMMFSGIAVILAFGLMNYGLLGWAYGLTFGVPTIIGAILSLVFTGVSRSEFHGITRCTRGTDSVSEYPKDNGGTKDEKAPVCPQGGEPIGQARSFPLRPIYPTIGGSLAIVSTGICMIISLFYVTSYATRPMYYEQGWGLLAEGSFGLVASAFGLAAGFLSLKRSGFWITTVGICFLLAQGFVITAALGSAGLFGTSSYGPVLGSPIVGLSLLSLASILASKQEFH